MAGEEDEEKEELRLSGSFGEAAQHGRRPRREGLKLTVKIRGKQGGGASRWAESQTLESSNQRDAGSAFVLSAAQGVHQEQVNQSDVLSS